MSKVKRVLPDLSKYYLKAYFISLDSPMHLISPVKLRVAPGSQNPDPTIAELHAMVGINAKDESVAYLLEQQQKQFANFKFWYITLSCVGYVLIAFPLLVFTALLVSILFDFDGVEMNIFFMLPIFMLSYMAVKLSQRIVSALLNSHYAGTLSFVTCLYLLVNLGKKDTLVKSKERGQLLSRIRGLKRYILLLPYQYAAMDLPAESWARGQFKHMLQFAEDKENQIIAPFANSRTDMFFELQAMLDILLSGNYGEFKYQTPNGTESVPPSNASSLPRNMLKFIGTVTPVILVVLMYFFPGQLQFLGIENKVITTISLAWLLLAIDSNLKLGIVERISSLAKAIKELN